METVNEEIGSRSSTYMKAWQRTETHKELNVRTVSRSLVAMTCDKKCYGRFRVTVYCDNCVLLSCESLLVELLLACST